VDEPTVDTAEDLAAAFEELLAEVHAIDALDFGAIPVEAHRRIRVRSCFALLDLCSRLMMCIARPLIFRQIIEANPHIEGRDAGAWLSQFVEILALNEIGFEVRDNGRVDTKPLKIRFGSQLLLSISAMHKATKEEYKKGDDQGYKAVAAAIEIRDRVTHPKSLADLQVSADDMQIVEQAFNWLLHHLKRCQSQMRVNMVSANAPQAPGDDR
jgi:hypothetical protein